MLKSKLVKLEGRDAGLNLRLHELPALVADRYARDALKAANVESDGGIVALALKHYNDVKKLGPAAHGALMPFVNGTVEGDGRSHAFDPARDLRDWRNVERVQQLALHLHVGFLFERQALDVPVAFRAAQITEGASDVSVTFCAPFLAAVIQSKLATYRELETVLSTEDAFNLTEILNVEALQNWQAHKDVTT
jgi:hypothetical protein